MKNKLFISYLLLIAFLAVPALASELHIDKSGNFHMDSANVVSTNNNFILVEVWGTKWSLFLDTSTKILGADDRELTMNGIEKGQLLTVDGMFDAVNKIILAATVVNESIGTPKPKLVLLPPPSPPIPTPLPAPKAATVSAKPVDASNVHEITSYLKLAKEGPEVLRLQQFLVTQGLLSSDNATGYYGWITWAAVKKFQLAHDLLDTGTVGPKTRAVLNSLLNGTPGTVAGASVSVSPSASSAAPPSSGKGEKITKYLRYTSKDPEVLILQNFLVSQGLLNADNVTGYFGDTTWDAVVAFQKNHGLEYKYGAIGPQTRNVINAMLAGQ
ncbi:MAG: hypothetical protein A3H69_01625 [Candidatus Sungbacteria bacterium RIFCSPLOWO2_02_FULL_47_9]|uniref:Peptidoglycan binding-like domain-containing protein n=1 Tax=Candidatus Sungbacteria bacterium RIFCSPHIGHO2_01_FULL_47_32 TaxID=1802264 RepID=A0A1G2K3S4_9BACT|nr:MAG: NLP/P60 protein [Parcubacteria group bacterium GW2011_GWA2_47_10]OGZ94079.1 MAG: hypothetical protein A2633_03905 [Candidatus Sungbacteria bacterium RIFCSPHIGHO2_01_FULL_47_32]OGZ98515.1 MAG: hypothetical protein A3D57_00100 [Candidatus Sungbacteria bacterium RIFCSPHIGHO2_02_FULL_46_12]OHA05283.1 MAG: hypothetical protein A3A28_01700 [Candidatus Sungbacteria bacterium RIFCSPLOWO2_01_FULL_47_32]OHA11749.1 MAG: hypothetical protein A3H69_01625 [Candidatus Sungbacteria bacterium RIFCSPLOWO